MTTPSDDQLATLGAAFDSFARRYKLADAGSSGRPLNELDKQAMLYVADHPGCGPTDVARFLGLAITTVSSATERLVKRGLMERHRVEGDRRAVALRLSDEGRVHADAQIAAHRAMYLMMLDPLTPSERDDFLKLITKIVYHDR